MLKKPEDIKVGDYFERTMKISQEQTTQFAEHTGDENPLHLSPEFARKTEFGQVNVNGMYCASLLVGMVGSKLPGPGWFCLGSNSDFISPILMDTSLCLKITVKQIVKAVNVIVIEGQVMSRETDEVLVRSQIKAKFMAGVQ